MKFFRGAIIVLLSSLVWSMVFNATFNTILVISCKSVLLVDETEVPGANHQPVQVTDKPYHIRNYETAVKISCIIFAENKLYNLCRIIPLSCL